MPIEVIQVEGIQEIQVIEVVWRGAQGPQGPIGDVTAEVEALVLEAQEAAEDASLSAAAAAVSADEAEQSAADAAVSAAAAAAFDNGLYPDTTAGLAATAEGGYFSTPGDDDDTAIIIWREVGGVAVEIDRLPNVAAINAARDANRVAKQVAALDAMIHARDWPTRPALSLIALPEELLPLGWTFTRASTAYRVNPNGLLETVASGEIRHDYHPTSGAYRGWLFEGGSTNRLRHSSDLSNAAWVANNVTKLSNTTIAPDGTMTADTIVESADVASHGISQTNTISPTQQWTFSRWFKPKERSIVQFIMLDNDTPDNYILVNFILSAGGSSTKLTHGGNAVGGKALITPYPDDWYRCALTGIPNTGGSQVEIRNSLMATDTGTSVYDGDGTSGIYTWGAQLEIAPRATSLIQTAAAAVSRAADNLIPATLGTWFNVSQGAMFLEYSEDQLPFTAHDLMSLNDGTADNQMTLRMAADNSSRFDVVDDAISQAVAVTAAPRTDRINRLVGLWERDNIGVTFNGAPVVGDTLGDIPDITGLEIETALRMHVSHVAIFTRRPADGEAQALSSPDVFEVTDESLFAWVTAEGFVLGEFDRDTGRLRYAGQASESPTDPELAEARNIWSGALTDSGFRFSFDVGNTTSTEANIRYEIATDEDFEIVVQTSAVIPPTERPALSGPDYLTFKETVIGLTADTEYFVRIEINGTMQEGYAFRLRTLPAVGVGAAVKLLGFSCISFSSATRDAPAFTSMAEEGADLAVCLGDLHYGNVSFNDIRQVRGRVRYTIANPDVQTFLAACPMVWITDDHDTGPNNIHRDSPLSSTTPLQVINNTQEQYSEMCPHYDLVHPGASFPGPDTVLAQLFDTANVQHLLLDMRSQREYLGEASPTVIGNGTLPAGSFDQKGWLKAAILDAGIAGRAAVCVWLPSVPHFSIDGWEYRAPVEYVEICDYIRDTVGVPQVYFFCGDIHYTAADDGLRTDNSTGGGMTVPCFLLSAVHQTSGGQIPDFWWQGVKNRVTNHRGYGVIDLEADGHLTVTTRGHTLLNPNDPEPEWVFDPVADTAEFSSHDDTPAVDFNGASLNASANSTVNIQIDKSWFGPPGPLDGFFATGSVAYTTDQGSPQSGTIRIRPSCGKYTLTLNTPASGSFVVTLSSPSSGIVLGAQTTCTVTIV